MPGRDFVKEVTSWKDEGIIDDYQSRAILAKYKLAKAPGKRPKALDVSKDERSSKSIAVIATLGAILVGIGIILLVASNWTGIPDFVKIVLLISTTSGIYFAGWKLKFDTPHYPRIGEAVLFLASISFGASIFLIAQVFNEIANSSFLLLLWFMAVAPLTYALSSKPILVLAILTFSSWIGSVLDGFSDSNLLSTVLIFLAFGMALYGIGHMHRSWDKFSKFATIYQAFGLIYLLSSFYYFSIESAYRISTIRLLDSAFEMGLFVFFTIVSLASVAAILISSRKTNAGPYEFIMLLVSFFGFAGMTLFIAMRKEFMVEVSRYGFTRMQLPEGVITAIFVIFTLLVSVIAIGTMLVGYYKGISAFVNIGIVFFILALAHVYWNTAVQFLPRSISLIIGGTLLIAGGIYLEKKRREMIKTMSENG
jgi:uncharacterized membrane protein